MDSISEILVKHFRWRLVSAAFLSGLGPFAFASAAQYAAVAPLGTESLLWSEVFVVGFLMLLAVFVVPLSFALVFFKRSRVVALYGLTCGLAFLVGLFGGWNVGSQIRMSAFLRLAERSGPLIAAIKAYEKDEGYPPQNLELLVPKYLPHVPSTGMGAYPKYEYVVNAVAGKFDDNPWVLYVFTPSGGINFDQFLYFPLQNYPKEGYGGSLERIGDWAYVHE